MQSIHTQQYSEEEDRQNRFLNQSGGVDGLHAPAGQGQRAASQPPRSGTADHTSFLSSPTQPPGIPSSFGNGSNAWSLYAQSRGANAIGIPQRSPHLGGGPGSASSFPRSFSSTFEEDEEDEEYDDRYLPPSVSARGRDMNDPSRSRSQSMATNTGRPIGLGGANYMSTSFNQGPGGRFGEIKPPGSRYGSLGALASSPIQRQSSYGQPSRPGDISNMSPFVRDVGQILLDDGSAFRELWAGMNPPRDQELGGGGSGTTSRRHSVSVVQPRRGTIVGFNAPGQDLEPEPPRMGGLGGGAFGGNLMLSDEDLADDFGSLSLQPPSQQAPLTPQQQEDPRDLPARFIPGQGIQYVAAPMQRRPSNAGPTSPRSPISPSAARHQSFFPSQPAMNELGKGVPLHAVPASWPLYIVEFKAGRTDLFYLTDLSQDVRIGDLVMVEADRGKDLGKVVNDTITIAEVEAFQRQQRANAQRDANGGIDEPPMSPGGGNGNPSGGGKKDINPKMMYGKARPEETQQLVTKMQDEMKALALCQNKVRAKKLPMEVVDAEYQWDRRKLTFYFVAEKRIDFRELVRELFRYVVS